MALAALPRSLALVSLHFLYIQNNGIFPNPLTAAASSSEGAPVLSFPLLGLCSTGLAGMLSYSPREAFLSTDLTNSHSGGFMSTEACPRGVPWPEAGVSSGAPEPNRPQGASEGSEAQGQRRMQILRPQRQPCCRHRSNARTNATLDRRVGRMYLLCCYGFSQAASEPGAGIMWL